MSETTPNATDVMISTLQMVVAMQRAGLNDEEIEERLREVNMTPDGIAGLWKTLPTFLEKTGGRVPGPPKVFLSHSHLDRETVAYIENILQKNGVSTFLDQHQIVPGQELKSRLDMGLLWCDKFILFWSAHAQVSDFVQWEWKRAQRLMKDIVPYALDKTPLPSRLKGRVFIDRSDQKHGHADLLRVVLGREWKPPRHTPFPGRWRAECNVLGFGEAEYELELRANGQIVGNGGVKPGFMAGIAGQDPALAQVLRMRFPISGTWSYDDREQILKLETSVTFMGRTNQEVVTVHTTGHDRGWIHGQSLSGMPWRLQRVARGHGK